MQTLVISDIHSNAMALQSVLKDAWSQYYLEEIWCLGDVVGYMPDPLLVWKTLRGQPIPDGAWLAGNHDWGLLGRLKGPTTFITRVNNQKKEFKISDFREKAWAVLQNHQNILGDMPEVISHLAQRPVMSQLRSGMYLTHAAFECCSNHNDVDSKPELRIAVTRYWEKPMASPADMAQSFDYLAEHEPSHIYNTVDVPTLPKLFVFGHTHKPGIWRWDKVRNQWITPDEMKESITQPYDLGDLTESPLCFNPGSIGQPRDGNGCPSYAVIDWNKNTLQFHRSWYNVNDLRTRMQELKPPQPYADLVSDLTFLPDCYC